MTTGSNSYLARLFATDIQDQAGNDLDGTNSGVGGGDATFSFGQSYTSPTVSLYNSATGWNTAMPLVFAPSIANDITSMSVSGASSTIISFTGNTTNKNILSALVNAGFAGGSVILEDMAAGFTLLDGFWSVTAVTDTASTDNITISTQPYGNTHLSTWSAGDMGSLHVSPGADAVADNYGEYDIEAEFYTALQQITGITSIPFTGTTPANGVYVGQTPQFDTNTLTDTVGYDKSFDNESELGQTGYIVNGIATSLGNNNLFIVGGGAAGEQDAIDAFLQSLGMEEYGPSNVATSSVADLWQITPNDNTSTGLAGAWDIRQVPSISYLNDSGGSGGWIATESEGWNTLYLFNYGGGAPAPSGGPGLGSLVTQEYNLGIASNVTNLQTEPDWWSSSTGGILNQTNTAATFAPYGTIAVGETYAITLVKSSNGSAQTVTYTATSSDTSASALVTDIVGYINSAAIQTVGAYSFFHSSSLIAVAHTDDELFEGNAASGSWFTSVPVVEFYAKNNGNAISFIPSTSVAHGTATFQVDTYQNDELNFSNPALYNQIINSNYFSNWLASATPDSMLSLSGEDGGVYDQSASTEAWAGLGPYQDTHSDWWGYVNGVLVTGVSESYWTLVNEVAQYVLQYTQNQIASKRHAGGQRALRRRTGL